MWKNIAERGRPQMTIRFACWVIKATNTHSEYVIHIACPLQKWLHERASMLRYTYIACLVIIDKESVYCAERTAPLNNTGYIENLKIKIKKRRMFCLRQYRHVLM
jgi:hypothetical protein